jgi:predicted nucleotidyltransferase
MEEILDKILNSVIKVKIIRLFTSRRIDFFTTGREVAKKIEVSVPATHSALKELYNYRILNRDIIGKQHLYRLNKDSRTVKDILIPAFKKEFSINKDIDTFLKEEIRKNKLGKKILSLLVYGSAAEGVTDRSEDIDIAIIVKTKIDEQFIEEIFIRDITFRFNEYFGIQLDLYVKTKRDFIEKIKNNKSPVSTIKKSYRIIYGEDPVKSSYHDSKKN